jgi:hypothetical protein
VGYGNRFWRSEYEPFQSLGIPEINNLGVDGIQAQRHRYKVNPRL